MKHNYIVNRDKICYFPDIPQMSRESRGYQYISWSSNAAIIRMRLLFEGRLLVITYQKFVNFYSKTHVKTPLVFQCEHLSCQSE